ncbi:Spore protein SP21 [Roseovarius litorisediminis]|uniref:Spore protein SP21 n=1 Tax=Roseovarius litorisediminis TaxID=1312363 RepID=A0A1Y5S537_9RHOB|nr:Hsp20/alpha crystallin family protein [Roseovarius litorisediminis]SLN32747.1 Spore protein SP21 [Roseovarius litorisediminis]
MVEKSQTHSTGLWPSIYEPFRSLGTRMADWLAPASDASADDNAYRITVELPGVDEKDIDVQVHEGVVSVTGEKSEEREEKGDTWFFSERQFGSFSRSFRLPADADGEKVDASLKDGVLTISVPKTKPKLPEAKKVKISKG